MSLLHSGKKTILIVDDEDQLSMLLKIVMGLKGYSAIFASNGQEAVDTYKANPDGIDLVLMDISMPVMSGVEAYRELKQFDPFVPIILMSGYTNNPFEGHANVRFIRKPINHTNLINAIKEVLEGSATCF
ncbi:MAG: response regulator [Geobacteraceae bacterium]|nr:response regulator [Geobacteraceae bacterium]